MRTTDLIFSFLYLAVLGVAATQISKLQEIPGSGDSARLFPEMVIGLGLLMGLVETARTLIARPEPNSPTLRQIWAGAFTFRRLVLLVLFVLYLAAIAPAGFLTATAVFCFVTAVVLSPARRWQTVVLSAVISGAVVWGIYMLLVVYLQAFLP